MVLDRRRLLSPTLPLLDIQKQARSSSGIVVWYADDLAVVVTGRTEEELSACANEAVDEDLRVEGFSG
ncbi:hypothetical protein J6590_027642 [Homalodisca vitripennis]|nr:hypothetical protein J6590_027642 [Homalodisca vitripennis]